MCCGPKKVLQQYESVSGQMINTTKSAITFSKKTPLEIRDRVKASLGITKEGGVGKYLGLPEHFGRRKKDMFTSIVDQIRQKAASWSSKQLSAAGKLVLLKSILAAKPSFSMTCFKLPKSLTKRIQSALTRFWWDANPEKKKMWTPLACNVVYMRKAFVMSSLTMKWRKRHGRDLRYLCLNQVSHPTLCY